MGAAWGLVQKKDLQGMPRIGGANLREAIYLFANNKSCAGDNVVSEMLRVLDEDVLDSMAESIETRILSREGETDGANEGCSRFVQYPYD
mgnify:CR=1 FL=1